jgi:hypothetical protein
MKTVFITERPTQIITSLILIEQLGLTKHTQIIAANRFTDAKSIINNLSRVSPEIEFLLTEDYDGAISAAQDQLPARLFMHWDVGFGTQRRLRKIAALNNNLPISIFEEGIGTYRQDIYTQPKRAIFRFLNLPTNVGGSKYTGEIFVFDKNKYISTATKSPPSINQIAEQYADFLMKHEHQFLDIFSGTELIKRLSDSRKRLCTIYLSDWKFKESDLNSIPKDDTEFVVKLHPHCKDNPILRSMEIAPRSLPAELLIISASKIFDRVNVYHKNSSAVIHIDKENITEINIAQTDK